MSRRRIEAAEAQRLAVAALVAAGATQANASATARALVAAEIDGQAGHGLSRVASYALQLRAGKVDGHAEPVATQPAPAVLRVDAGHGFAYPAIDLALGRLVPLARQFGIAAAAIHSSHHFGKAGHHVERLAEAGLVALAFANTPRAMAFHGGQRAMMGTNPIAFAAPLPGRAPLLVDLSLSVAARGRIVMAAKEGRPIPQDWAVDAGGAPTTDPAAALEGSLLPIGGAKGSALALMIEVLCGALVGGAYGWDASSMFDDKGGPPRLAHLLIAMQPPAFAPEGYEERLDHLVAAVAGEAPARLPGERRIAARERAVSAGLEIPEALFAELSELAAEAAPR